MVRLVNHGQSTFLVGRVVIPVAVAARPLQLACQHHQQHGAGDEALGTRRQHLGDAQQAEG